MFALLQQIVFWLFWFCYVGQKCGTLQLPVSVILYVLLDGIYRITNAAHFEPVSAKQATVLHRPATT